jgi:NAD-dependent SIR2 family protein deacetylase
MDLTDTLKQVKKALEDADSFLITAGAGMGVDSGLPDFRGKEGFWNAYPYAKKLGLNFQDLANPRWFKTDPYLAWAFYGHRLNLYRNTQPHQGFYILKKFVELKNNNYFIFTSNVDGQFQKAGFHQERIVEIHGSIHYLQCTLPCNDDIWLADNVEVKVDIERFRALDPLPTCKNCGRIARPNILMFGDFEWIPIRTESQEFRFDLWLEKQRHKRLVIVEIGAGKAVPTVRLTSERIAREFNATLIRINPRDYDVPANIKAFSIPTGGLDGLRLIFEDVDKPVKE